MDRGLALHSAVRRWLPERYMELSAIGSALPASDQAVGSRSQASRSLVPRYWFIRELQDQIERLDPDALPPLDELAECLIEEALTMPVEGRVTGDIEADALAEERGRIAAHIRDLATSDLDAVEPLPYRRTLSADETGAWLDRITAAWLGGNRHDWWAMYGAAVNGERDDVVLVREDAFFGPNVEREALGETRMWRAGLGPATLAVREALGMMAVDRVVVLREWGPSREVAAIDLDPTYGDGGEGLFTSDGLSWLLHASHEDVYSIGGSIVEPFTSAWPSWRLAEWQDHGST